MRSRHASGWILVGSVLLLLGSVPALADGDVNFILGTKQLDSNDWGQLDEQGEFGVLMSFGRADWPVRIAIDLIGTADQVTVVDPLSALGVEVTGSTVEVDFGVRKIWERNKMRPFLGGGIGVISAEIEGAALGVVVSSDDNDLGFWIDGGIFWRLGRRFNLGFEARISRAEVQPALLGESFDVEAGGEHLGLTLGWGW